LKPSRPWPRAVFADPGDVEPRGQAFGGFGVEGGFAFFVALAMKLEDAVLAIGLEVADIEFHEFVDATGGVSQDGEDGSITDTSRGLFIGRVHESSAGTWREAHGFAVAGHGRGLDEVAVGRIGAGVAVDLQVRVQGANGRRCGQDGRRSSPRPSRGQVHAWPTDA